MYADTGIISKKNRLFATLFILKTRLLRKLTKGGSLAMGERNLSPGRMAI